MPIPRPLIEGATAARREATERWWSALDEETRRVLETGRIPHDFACPLGRPSCPFARALAQKPGRAIVLSARPRTTALRGW